VISTHTKRLRVAQDAVKEGKGESPAIARPYLSNGYYEEDGLYPVGGCMPHRTGAMRTSENTTSTQFGE
jgi:hypothetical protein